MSADGTDPEQDGAVGQPTFWCAVILQVRSFGRTPNIANRPLGDLQISDKSLGDRLGPQRSETIVSVGLSGIYRIGITLDEIDLSARICRVEPVFIDNVLEESTVLWPEIRTIDIEPKEKVLVITSRKNKTAKALGGSSFRTGIVLRTHRSLHAVRAGWTELKLWPR